MSVKKCPNQKKFMEGIGAATLPKNQHYVNNFDHGTKVSLVAKAVNPKVDIIFIRVVPRTDDGLLGYYSDKELIMSINWILKNKEKFNITNHIGLCRFLQLSRREQTNELEQLNEELPTQLEMFRIIQHLSLRIDKLEKDNTKLRYQTKKINIIEYLNSSVREPPKCVLKEWVSTSILPKIDNYMDVVYKQNLVDSISLLFEDVFWFFYDLKNYHYLLRCTYIICIHKYS
jgi:hypothetical protein